MDTAAKNISFRDLIAEPAVFGYDGGCIIPTPTGDAVSVAAPSGRM